MASRAEATSFSKVTVSMAISSGRMLIDGRFGAFSNTPGVRCCAVFLICISLITSAQLFLGLLVVLLSAVNANLCVRSFFCCVVWFFLLIFRGFIYVLDTNLLSTKLSASSYSSQFIDDL